MAASPAPGVNGFADDERKEKGWGHLGPLLLVFWTRGAALGVAAVCSIATTAVLVGHFGAMSVGWMSLVASLVGFFALFDLGMSAIVTNAAAAAAGTALRSVIASSTRALLAVSVTMLVLTALAWPLGLWDRIVGAGAPSGVAVAAAVSSVLFCICLPFTQAQAALTGFGAVHVSVAAGVIRPLVVLFGCLLGTALGWSLGACLSTSAVGLLLSHLAQAAWLRRRYDVAIPASPGRAWRAKPLGRSHRGTAVAMLIINISVPVLLGTDQLILAHAASADLAEYALVNQFFLPLYAVVATIGTALWSRFASARLQRRDVREELARWTLLFGLGSLGVCLVMVAAVLVNGTRASREQITVGALTLAAFSLLLFVQSLRFPLAMYLTGPSGLRFQAGITAVIAVINLPLSFAAASSWGAAGPPSVSASLLLILFFANAWKSLANPRLDWSR